jgi:hypothetical protein
MADKRRPTQYETRAAIRRLEEGLESLRQFLDPQNDDCSVPAEVREASKSYLQSWVEGPAEGALKMLMRSQEGKPTINSHWQDY